MNVIICGVSVVSDASGDVLSALIAGSLMIVVGAALFAGLLTPVVSALATIAYLLRGVSPSLPIAVASGIGTSEAITLAAVSLALVFLGPGAFSVDARLFGRREIIIPDK